MLGYTNVTTFYENDVYMAFLPLAHVLELIAGTMRLVCLILETRLAFNLQRAFGCYLAFLSAIPLRSP